MAMKKLKPASWLIIILVLLAIFFWWACALPGWKDPYTGPLSPTNREEVFDPSCLPVEIRQGSDTALFLVHGLNHSPQCWEQWLPDFQAAGYDVYAPLISGFGTSIEDYEHSCYPQWYQSMKDQYLQVRSRYKHVVYIGHSLGGMMGLQLAEETSGTPLSPDLLVTISTPVVCNSLKDRAISQPLLFIARPLSLITPHTPFAHLQSRKPARHNSDGHETWTGYDGTFFKQALSTVFHMPEVRAGLKRITIPVLSIQDKRDRTVSSKNLSIIQNEIGSKEKEMLMTHLPWGYWHTYHCLPLYRALHTELVDAILSFLEAHHE